MQKSGPYHHYFIKFKQTYLSLSGFVSLLRHGPEIADGED
jgi:hypothetical protein